MQLAVLLFTFLLCYCSVQADSACKDEVDNVLTVQDCGDEDALIKFDNLVIHAYDTKKNAKCLPAGSDDVRGIILPGHAKIAAGSIHIKETLDLEGKNTLLLFTLEKNSWAIGAVCQDGKSQSVFVSENDCRFDLCKLIGSQFCSMFSQKGVIEIPSIMPEFLKYIPLPALTSSAIEGQWKGDIKIMYGGNIIGCLRYPGNGEWVELKSESEKTEL
uniref:Uncharacterized protein n=1 Tax=Plectus sambesii TaxID=2011161 RepID=A0A914X501_9BILA